MQQIEDLDVTNQYTALGSVKPGLFRRGLLTVLLVAIQFACRHVFTRGYLGRVQTIYFARWVFLDNKTRVLFTSNYDGGHQAYMDDFINKAAWGLNIAFSHGIGWPRTDWLITRGARRELQFKAFQRRHQPPTQVGGKAYPGLTLVISHAMPVPGKGSSAPTCVTARSRHGCGCFEWSRRRDRGVELDDIQGLVRFAFKHHTEAVFLLLRITEPAAARSGCRRCRSPTP